MKLLPDEEGAPVGALVKTLIGEALRHSVAQAEPSPGFAARLAAALDAADADAASTAGAAGAAKAGEAGGAGPDGVRPEPPACARQTLETS